MSFIRVHPRLSASNKFFVFQILSVFICVQMLFLKSFNILCVRCASVVNKKEKK